MSFREKFTQAPAGQGSFMRPADQLLREYHLALAAGFEACLQFVLLLSDDEQARLAEIAGLK